MREQTRNRPLTARLAALEDRVFTDRRLRLYSSAMVIAWIFFIAWFLYRFRNMVGPASRHACNDFSWMWISSAFARSSDPARVYVHSAFSLARVMLTGADHCLYTVGQFVYPPTYLFFTYPLGFMPFPIAYFVWILATLFLYLAAIYMVIPSRTAVIAALTPNVIVYNFLSGHNGFLSAGLVGLSLAVMQRRPRLAGLFLGLLTYKPQLGMLFPFALLASRKWRVILSAAATGLGFGVAAAIAFGYLGWVSFFHTLVHREPSLSPDSRVPILLASVYGILQSSGVRPDIALAAHLAVAVPVAGLVCVIWAKRLPHALQAAALCAGALVVTPFVHSLDFCILPVAAAFLVKDEMSRGFLPGERIVLLICWFALIPIMSSILYQTVACVVLSLVILGVVARRVAVYRREPISPAHPAPARSPPDIDAIGRPGRD